MLSKRSTQDLVQIVANGGGLDFDASNRPHLDCVQIAANATGSARVIFRGIGGRLQVELVQIVANGKGCVVLAD